MSERVAGRDLRVGDTVDCWWGRDTITALRPYDGLLPELADARIAEFARGMVMTIEPAGTYVVMHRMVS